MSAQSAPQQQTQPPLLPTLYALLPPDSSAQVQATISLLSLHSEVYEVHDKIYLNEDSVLPNQKRVLQLRTRRPSPRRPLGVRALNGGDNGQSRAEADGAKGEADKEKKEEKEEKGGKDGEAGAGEMSLAYISQPHSGREYDGVSVRAVVEVDIAGLSLEEDVEDFIRTLGFSYSHEYTRTGILFHLALPHPSLTLHLTMTKIRLPNDSSIDGPTSEPFLLQLQPSRPISGGATKGELGVGETIELMNIVSKRIGGLEWGNGRK